MTTDLSPSGIQRLLEICDTRISGSDIAVSGGIEDLNFIAEARTALPDALREIETLTGMLTAQRVVSDSVSRGYSAIQGMNTKARGENKSLRDRIEALEEAASSVCFHWFECQHGDCGKLGLAIDALRASSGYDIGIPEDDAVLSGGNGE